MRARPRKVSQLAWDLLPLLGKQFFEELQDLRSRLFWRLERHWLNFRERVEKEWMEGGSARLKQRRETVFDRFADAWVREFREALPQATQLGMQYFEMHSSVIVPTEIRREIIRDTTNIYLTNAEVNVRTNFLGPLIAALVIADTIDAVRLFLNQFSTSVAKYGGVIYPSFFASMVRTAWRFLAPDQYKIRWLSLKTPETCEGCEALADRGPMDPAEFEYLTHASWEEIRAAYDEMGKRLPVAGLPGEPDVVLCDGNCRCFLVLEFKEGERPSLPASTIELQRVVHPLEWGALRVRKTISKRQMQELLAARFTVEGKKLKPEAYSRLVAAWDKRFPRMFNRHWWNTFAYDYERRVDRWWPEERLTGEFILTKEPYYRARYLKDPETGLWKVVIAIPETVGFERASPSIVARLLAHELGHHIDEQVERVINFPKLRKQIYRRWVAALQHTRRQAREAIQLTADEKEFISAQLHDDILKTRYSRRLPEDLEVLKKLVETLKKVPGLPGPSAYSLVHWREFWAEWYELFISFPSQARFADPILEQFLWKAYEPKVFFPPATEKVRFAYIPGVQLRNFRYRIVEEETDSLIQTMPSDELDKLKYE